MRLPYDRAGFRVFQRAFTSRIPAPVGCLLVLVLLPIVLVFLLVVVVMSLFRGRSSSQKSTTWPMPRAQTDHETALCMLVRALALDESFSLDDARQAGTLATAGVTVDDLLRDARRRDWVEVRGDRFAVTPRGREEAEGRLRALGL